MSKIRSLGDVSNMKEFMQEVRRAVYALAITVLAVAAVAPSLNHPAVAAQLTSRSIELSSSNAGATSTTYLISFTTATTGVIKSLVVDFCDNTPIIGDSTCTAPTGFSVGTPSASQSGLPAGTWTPTSANTNRTLILTNASNVTSTPSSTAITITLTTATNPTTDNHSFYARILTYPNSSGANSAATYAPGSEGSYTDGGGVAMSTGKVINITARVMESLAFCVYSATCGDDPSMTIGHGTNNILDATAVDTQTADFSLSTNAQSGATVRLKGDTLKSGANSIAAAGASAITFVAGTANFGMRISSAGSGVTATSPYDGGSGTQYAYNTTNTLSTYGDGIATLSGPVSASVTVMTFAATAANTTPAGIYTTTAQLIATGQF